MIEMQTWLRSICILCYVCFLYIGRTMMKKRIVAFIVVLCMGTGMFTGCSSKNIDGRETIKTEENVQNQELIDNNSKTNDSSEKLTKYDIVPTDDITKKCLGCEKAAKYYNSIIKAYDRILAEDIDAEYYLNAADEVKQRFYDAMHHDCMADTIIVEEVPYILWNYEGIYSGEWKGNGPCGKGTFVGKYVSVSFISDRKDDKFYYYNGDWEYGFPNGIGEYWQEDGHGTGEVYYVGGVKDGKRNGKGLMIEYFSGEYKVMNLPMEELRYYRDEDVVFCFHETEYKDDAMVSETGVEIYNNDEKNTLRGAGKVKWDYDTNSYTYIEYERRITDKEILEMVLGGIIVVGYTQLLIGTIGALTWDNSEWGIEGLQKRSEESNYVIDKFFNNMKNDQNDIVRKDYENQAYYWENKHNDLLINDPNGYDYQTQIAEYNKNYFNRLANSY